MPIEIKENERMETGCDKTCGVSIRAERKETDQRSVDAAFLARLRELAEDAGGVSAMARAAGFGESTLRKWLEGGSEPNRSRLVQLAHGAGVSVGWLAAGVGPKTPESSGRIEEPIARYRTADMRALYDVMAAAQRCEAVSNRDDEVALAEIMLAAIDGANGLRKSAATMLPRHFDALAEALSPMVSASESGSRNAP